MSNIKPVLTQNQLFDIDETRSTTVDKYRAIEREVLLATRDCRTCENYLECCRDSARTRAGISTEIHCTNQSHYTETPRVDLSRKE